MEYTSLLKDGEVVLEQYKWNARGGEHELYLTNCSLIYLHRRELTCFTKLKHNSLDVIKTRWEVEPVYHTALPVIDVNGEYMEGNKCLTLTFDDKDKALFEKIYSSLAKLI